MNRPAHHSSLYRILDLPGAGAVNRAILTRYQAVKYDADLKRSHFFAGRYENIYVPEQRVPAVRGVLEVARAEAARLTGAPGWSLGIGFWFNEMGPGQVTLAHSHDDDDELLSAVYYVSVPAESGYLVLGRGDAAVTLAPRAGRFVFFAPELVHEVTENRSDATRLSIGMNFGVRGREGQ
jgi:hypothetical protein